MEVTNNTVYYDVVKAYEHEDISVHVQSHCALYVQWSAVCHVGIVRSTQQGHVMRTSSSCVMWTHPGAIFFLYVLAVFKFTNKTVRRHLYVASFYFCQISNACYT